MGKHGDPRDVSEGDLGLLHALQRDTGAVKKLLKLCVDSERGAKTARAFRVSVTLPVKGQRSACRRLIAHFDFDSSWLTDSFTQLLPENRSFLLRFTSSPDCRNNPTAFTSS